MTRGVYSRSKECESCGVVFVSRGSTARYCSAECRFTGLTADVAPDSRGCLLWPHSRNPKSGYGQMTLWDGNKRRLATTHRMSFSIAFGNIPTGLEVCHRCDVPACFNPKHLFPGTQQDNMRDCVAKGRAGDYPARIRKGWRQRRLAMSSADSLK